MKIVLVGAGEVGRYLAEILYEEAHDISILEVSESLAEELNERFDTRVVCASGTSVTSLAEASVAECDLFLALTSDDNTNLVAASIARAMGAPKTIARVHASLQREEWLFDYKTHFGIDYLFSTERLAAVELAKYVRNPEKILVEELARGRIELQQVQVTAESAICGRSVMELKLPPRIRIAFIQRADLTLIPTARELLQAGDLVTLFGDPNLLSEVLPLLHEKPELERDPNVVIFGGGEYGFALAQMLEGKKLRVRILEKDSNVCRDLSEILQRTVVINGDATSLQQLREEQVGEADFFIATSRDDEDNVMTCLQARSLGTKYCLTLIHRADYADVVSQHSERLGILGAVSPRLAASRDLLRFVTSERFHVVMKLIGGLEVIEAIVRPESKLAGRKVAEVEWPEETGLVALLKGSQAIVPGGDDAMETGDTLYAIVSGRAKRGLVKLLG